MKKIRIHWTKKIKDPIYNGYEQRIRKKFNIQDGITINGESFVTLDESLLNDLKETEHLGFIEIRNITNLNT